MSLIWSPLPKEAYSVLHQGQMVGPFCAEHINMPGVWNIQFLCIAEALEALRSYEGDTGEFPVSFNCTPAVIGASLQKSDADKTLGEWAEELTPTAWIDRALTVQNFILTEVYPLWEMIAREAAASYVPRSHGNLYIVDFGTGRRVR
ncbi:MAG: hypothetical protein A2512_04475 [Deltaproteobacteria bacterium RIFOXYD12_FULL_56_24]|nr:MAG: hypothetical protein A2512_04475 [Deltaproteobacteria bacterium RIFOXYD12_FULL_56_24]